MGRRKEKREGEKERQERTKSKYKYISRCGPSAKKPCVDKPFAESLHSCFGGQCPLDQVWAGWRCDTGKRWVDSHAVCKVIWCLTFATLTEQLGFIVMESFVICSEVSMAGACGEYASEARPRKKKFGRHASSKFDCQSGVAFRTVFLPVRFCCGFVTLLQE